ncbi:class I adenylate-forming enzyme family protein [Terrarubrum flagellatum]|uniref:class I adenylate-forming enzyme family protein n=1 Tax=Terrirubrum flagellatum TaxID=2895980 RepID=UPI0031454A11
MTSGGDGATIDAAVLRAGRSTVYDLFRQTAEHAPASIAIEHGASHISYGELLRDVNRLAFDLSRRGDRVAVLSENRPEYLRLLLAAAAIGAIVACQNVRLARAELQHCVALAAPKLIFVSARHAATAAQLDCADASVLNIAATPDDAPGADPFTGDSSVDPEDPLILIYTSGTTGLPKGALISHRAEIARMAVAHIDLGGRRDDAMFAWAPMYHIGGVDQALAALMLGGTVVITDGFHAPPLIDALSRHRFGWLLLVPGIIEPVVEELERSGVAIRGVSSVGCMADLVPPALIARATKAFNAPFLNSFGMTETGLAPLSGDLILVGVAPMKLSKRLNTLCEFKLIDAEGREVAPGEVGEGAVRGPTLFSGYWNAPEATARDFSNGFFRMGDLFRRTPDGAYDFVDRARYLIKSGGENIYPAEIERVLLADPRVSDAIVVRKPDAKWGEVPVAFVARTDDSLDEAAIETLCRRALASYKRPKEVRFVAFADFPRSTSGKIVRSEMEKRL